jgi:hypothetical protein
LYLRSIQYSKRRKIFPHRIERERSRRRKSREECRSPGGRWLPSVVTIITGGPVEEVWIGVDAY